MRSSTSLTSFELMARVAEFAQDSRFLFELQQLVAAHQRALDAQARTEAVKQRLLTAPATDPQVQLLLKLAAAQQLRYGPREFVPDGYQSLDDLGFVDCEHGPKDYQGLDSRTLRLTTAGRNLANLLLEKLALADASGQACAVDFVLPSRAEQRFDGASYQDHLQFGIRQPQASYRSVHVPSRSYRFTSWAQAEKDLAPEDLSWLARHLVHRSTSSALAV